jgi:hypothetical protein
MASPRRLEGSHLAAVSLNSQVAELDGFGVGLLCGLSDSVDRFPQRRDAALILGGADEDIVRLQRLAQALGGYHALIPRQLIRLGSDNNARPMNTVQVFFISTRQMHAARVARSIRYGLINAGHSALMEREIFAYP